MPATYKSKQKKDFMSIAFIPIKPASSTSSYGRTLPCKPVSKGALSVSIKAAAPEERETTSLFLPDSDDEDSLPPKSLHPPIGRAPHSSGQSIDPDLDARNELLARLAPPVGARKRFARVNMCAVADIMNKRKFRSVYGSGSDGIEVYSTPAINAHGGVVVINPELGLPLTDIWGTNTGEHSHLYLPQQQARMILTMCKKLREFHLFVKCPPPNPGFTDSVYMGVYSLVDTNVGMSVQTWHRRFNDELKDKVVLRDIKYSAILAGQGTILQGSPEQAAVRNRYDSGLSTLSLVLLQNVRWDQALAEELHSNAFRVVVPVNSTEKAPATMMSKAHAAKFALRKTRKSTF